MFDNRFGHLLHPRTVGGIADHHAEFVAAKTAANLVLGHQALEPSCDLAQQPVAGQVAERIIDRLEAVEVDHQKGAARSPFCGISDCIAKCLVEHQTVGQRS